MKAIKITCVILTLCICFLSFCACSPNKAALTVNSSSVSREVFGYFLSVAQNSLKYSEEKNKKEIAAGLCAEYIAGLSLIEKYSVTLSPEEKVIVSSEVKTNWQLYSSFYEKYSVSKQALCSMLEYESLVNALVEKLYSQGGERAIDEKEVTAFFNKNYLSAKIAFTPFEKTFSKEEVESITDKFTSMSETLRAGGSFSSAMEQYPDLAEYEDVERLVSAFDSSYPEEFFKKLSGIAKNEVQVMRFQQGIYLVQKADAAQFFNQYKTKCIVKMKKEQVLNEISELAAGYEVEYNSAVVKKVMSSAGIR